jgi:hypothetical protein
MPSHTQKSLTWQGFYLMNDLVCIFFTYFEWMKTNEYFHFYLYKTKNVPSVQETAYCLFKPFPKRNLASTRLASA